MGKKGALTSVFSRSRSWSGVDSPPWPWPSCGDPQTDSFRAGGEPCASAASGSKCGPVAARHRKLAGAAAAAAGEMYKTVNSVYFDPDGGESCSGLKDEEEWVVVEDDGFPAATACAEDDCSEAVIRSLSRTTSSTHRFFFDQDRLATSFILPAAAASVSSPASSTPPEEEEESAAPSEKEKQPVAGDGGKSLVVEESVALAVESADPYQDFLASMEEMVAAHGLRGWDALEELLVWYLRVNAKRHHPLIVSAFVDLLVGLTTTPSSTSTTTTATTVTTSSSGTSTSSSASIGSSKSTSTSTTTTSTGDGVVAPVAAEQCGGGNGKKASSSSSCVPCGLDEAGRGDD
jgi:uncharacterized protein (TIGR01568 family)